MHQAFYRKYRPQVFSDVVGRDTVTTVLRGQVKSGKVSHAYLFCGMRGSGKTTCAKILAKAVNCLHPVDGDPCGECENCRAIDSGLTLDIVEMDAASNNGVNDIRDMIEQVTYTPAELKTRVYIIDEVHMLSNAAFNALLKTLEEPPAHVMFILATTELHKLPATIVSRCQRFDFEKLEMSDIVKRLRYVADCEHIDCDDDALYVMAKEASGALRDALGYLELCAASGLKLDEKTVSHLLGTSRYDTLISIADAASSRDYGRTFAALQEAYSQVNEVSVMWLGLISVYRDMLVIKTTGSYSYVSATPSQAKRLSSIIGRFSKEKLLSAVKIMNDALYLMQRLPEQKQMIADLSMLKICDERLDSSYESLQSRVAALEDGVSLGTVRKAAATDETFLESIAKNEPEPVSENAAPEPEKEQKTMKIFRGFADVVSKMKAKDRSCSAYMAAAKAYECSDGTLRILFDNNFALSLAEGAKELIDVTVMSVTDKYDGRTIKLEPVKTESEFVLIDEVIEAANEDNGGNNES